VLAAVPPAANAPTLTEAPVDQTAGNESGSGLGGDASLAALLVALGLAGGAGFLAMRSRRRRASDESERDDVLLLDEPAASPRARAEAAMPIARELPEPHFAPAPAPAVTARPATVGYTMLKSPIVEADENGAEPAREAPLATPTPTTTPIPDGPLPRGEDRDALIQRMIAREPDSENPFRSRKARGRRARIILQTLEQKQREAASEAFDWRTYDSGRHSASASPQPVTV
jgi:hypothetical protein